MKARVVWRDGVYFEGEASGHIIPIEGRVEKQEEERGDEYPIKEDTIESKTGVEIADKNKNRGMRPMETILIGLGACSSYDVVIILYKMRQEFTQLEVQLEADRVDQIPAVFSHIRMHFRLSGKNLDPAKVKRAVSLSVDKYCSVAKMLTAGGVKIEHSFEILPNDKRA